jgi:GTPase
MPLPMVAIVGRPNVGKSSLLNMLAGKRISIVDPTAGVTRDRVQTLCEFDGLFFELVDTGGFGIVDRDDLGEQVEQQIRYAVDQATLILFVVDAQEGVSPLDQTVAEWLRRCSKPIVLLANKVDSPETHTELADLMRLGFGEPLTVSAVHHLGLSDLRERIIEELRPFNDGTAPSNPVMKMAIVGRRNVGKSSFINALAGQERVIVSEVAGTTRDAIDVKFERDGHTYMAIDTAGVRKRSKLADDVEYYGFHRAQLSIRRADVVLLMLDATDEVSHVDKLLGGYIVEQFRPCVLVINKWDLAKGRAVTGDYSDYLHETLSGLDFAPIVFTTANQNRNVQAAVDVASSLFKQARTRVTTHELNNIVEDAMNSNPPKPKHGCGPVKVFYVTQVAVCPPTIAMFINDPGRVTPGFERFMLNRLRERLPFQEVPIRLLFRGKRPSAAQREEMPPER